MDILRRSTFPIWEIAVEELRVVILHFYFIYLYSVVDFTFYDF